MLTADRRAPAKLSLLLTALDAYDPSERPAHCVECRWCVVRGVDYWPTAECQRGHGKAVSLWQLVRPHHPSGFARMGGCPDFESMEG